VRPIGSRCSPIQPFVDVVQLLAKVAPHVKPPVAHEHGLTELRAVRTQERCLSAIDVTIMPGLTPGVHVREEARVWLVIAVEVCVWHHGQYRVVRAWFACKRNEMLVYVRIYFELLNIEQCTYNQFPNVYYIQIKKYCTTKTKVGHLQVNYCYAEVRVQRCKISTDIVYYLSSIY